MRLNWRIIFFPAVQSCAVCLFVEQLFIFFFPFFLQCNVYLQYNEDHGGGGGGGQNTILPNFQQKTYEIMKILGRRGARAGGVPLDPPLILNIKDPSNNLPVQQNTCW